LSPSLKKKQPFYDKGVITKSQFKDIAKKSTEKITVHELKHNPTGWTTSGGFFFFFCPFFRHGCANIRGVPLMPTKKNHHTRTQTQSHLGFFAHFFRHAFPNIRFQGCVCGGGGHGGGVGACRVVCVCVCARVWLL
jgi:hypothetical protein